MTATACRFMYVNRADTGTLTATDAATSFPAANIQTSWPQLPWRSLNVTGTKYLIWDMASAVPVTACVILNHNLTTGATASLQGSTNNSDWTSLGSFTMTRDDGGTTIARDPLVLYIGTVSYRYFRLVLADAANPAGYMSVARVFLGEFVEATRNYVLPWGVTPIDLSLKQRATNGVLHVNEKVVYRFIEHGYVNVLWAQREAFRRMLDTVKAAKTFFLDLAPDDTATDQMVFYVRFKELPKLEKVTWQHWSYSCAFEEDV